MIIIDTNVVAEAMRASPAPAVVAWFNAQSSASLFLTAISVGEIRYGLRIMPEGQRRQTIERGFDQIIATAFAGRILAFDEHAAAHYGEVMGQRKEIGRPLSVPDGQTSLPTAAPSGQRGPVSGRAPTAAPRGVYWRPTDRPSTGWRWTPSPVWRRSKTARR